MGEQIQQEWEKARRLDRQLHVLFKENAPTFDEIDRLIDELRIACENVIFLDFKYATQQGVEKCLWDAHIAINSRYRKLVDKYRKGEQKKHVERRKLEKRYVDFIKRSQFFYKGYIQRLASHFDGMAGLRRIANRLRLSVVSADDRIQVAPEVQGMIELSCHATLLRLGDLSRYRNTLRTKDRSWEPALAYYQLANDLRPESGSAHNQMAVISLQDGHHLDAIYHIYRAIVIKEPHAVARSNLEFEFKKVIFNWEKRTHAKPEKTDIAGTLISWFNLLHARFFEGVAFSTQEELEKEVLSRVAVLLKGQNFEETLEKLVIINIAAEDFAKEKVEENDPPNGKDLQSFLFTLAFNVRFMLVLLQTLQPELVEQSLGEDIPNGTTAPKIHDRISATCRRVLPALRQYSAWLITRTKILLAAFSASPVSLHVRDLWKMYAVVLTRLVSYFPIEELQPSPYLLEEDEGTFGFRPFRDLEIPSQCSFYVDADNNPKPRITDYRVKRNHPNVEMQARALDIVLIGLQLQLGDECPISLTSDTGNPVFTFVENGPDTLLRPQSSSKHSANSKSGYQDIPTAPSSQIQPSLPDENFEPLESNFNCDEALSRMVEDLVDESSSTSRSTSRLTPSEETSYDMHSRTANEVFAPLGSNARHHTLHQSSPKMLPSLPGIWSSPFTPQLHELQPRSPIRPTSARQQSPLASAFASNQGRLAAAQELDRITGQNPWAHSGSQPLVMPPPQSVNPGLQQTQYLPPASIASSGFTNSSSIYANTPAYPRTYTAIGGASAGGGAGNNTTHYADTTELDRYAIQTMLNSTPYNGSQPVHNSYAQTPPGGQGG